MNTRANLTVAVVAASLCTFAHRTHAHECTRSRLHSIRASIIAGNNYLFRFPLAGYGYAICGGPDSSVLAATGEWIFMCDTPHSSDASDSRKATCVSDAPSVGERKTVVE